MLAKVECPQPLTQDYYGRQIHLGKCARLFTCDPCLYKVHDLGSQSEVWIAVDITPHLLRYSIQQDDL